MQSVDATRLPYPYYPPQAQPLAHTQICPPVWPLRALADIVRRQSVPGVDKARIPLRRVLADNGSDLVALRDTEIVSRA
jgi:hypothetical protein